MKKPVIIIIGAGAAGISTALNLADKGYSVQLIEKHTLGSGASGRNPGRMGHGFHYIDKETAKAYLHGSIRVQRSYPSYLIGQELPFDSPLRHGRYFITKDSKLLKEKILETYNDIQAEYKRLIDEDPANEVFGPADKFYRILDPCEYQDVVNMDIVDIGVETAEHLFMWDCFQADIKEKIEKHPNIVLREYIEVTDISRNSLGKRRFTIKCQTSAGEPMFFETDYIINSTWQDIERLNDTIGLKMIPEQRTNRLKTLLVVNLPESLMNANSMFFCMGQHCMMSNMGNGKAMMTFARVTNLETSSGLRLSKKAERLLNGGVTQEEKDSIANEMLHGISQYIPLMADATIVDLKFGIVQTKGKLSLSELSDPSHDFNRRDDHFVRTEQIGVVSNPCMKLFYFVDNGEIASNLIEEHIVATEIIRQCMQLIKEKAAYNQIEFDEKIERAVLENMERYGSVTLKAEDAEKIADTLLKTILVKSLLVSFFPQKKKYRAIRKNSKLL